MPKKKDLLSKLTQKPSPANFTTRELDLLMSKCGCKKGSGGRGSALRYVHTATNKVLTFDGPHPGNELYPYQIKRIIAFLEGVGEIEREENNGTDGV